MTCMITRKSCRCSAYYSICDRVWKQYLHSAPSCRTENFSAQTNVEPRVLIAPIILSSSGIITTFLLKNKTKTTRSCSDHGNLVVRIFSCNQNNSPIRILECFYSSQKMTLLFSIRNKTKILTKIADISGNVSFG
jgi:hypothetical protein